ncbi:hypothetical protein PCI56_14505 [Plesiomonas shigelloides subsp. oncorhynchi]|nr:hypothetical protein [Plesiomonas shigelloides]
MQVATTPQAINWPTNSPMGISRGKVVVADNFITGRGLGVSFEFSFTVAHYLLQGAPKVAAQAEHIYFDYWRHP